MAAAHGLIPTLCGFRPSDFRQNGDRKSNRRNPKQRMKGVKFCRAMVQKTVQGVSATYAKEMDKISAKESLLLAFKDAGGFEALVTGKVNDMQ